MARQVQAPYTNESQLIRQAFGTNKEVALNYDEAFVASAYEYPGCDLALSPAFYAGDQLVSLMASFPRPAVWRGRPVQLALLTWNSVHPDYRGQGRGIENVAEATRRARQGGYDGVILYCVDGSPANQTTVKGVEAAGSACPRVFTVSYLMGMVPPQPTAPGEEAAPAAEQVASFLRWTSALPAATPLARQFNPAAAAWECQSRRGAVTEFMRVDGREGLLTGYVMTDAQQVPYLFVESLLWGDLREEERVALVRRLLNRVAGRARLAIVPVMNYAPVTPFSAAGFRRAPRRLHAYLSCWDSPASDPLPSLYFDVF